MVHAEIHRKVPSKIRGNEDVLTSTAFGLLTLLPPDLVLRPWFESARDLDGNPPALDATYSRVASRYWPRFPELGDQTEIDLVLSLLRPDGSADLVVVEVKYLSGPSGWPVARELDSRVRGQLGREWAIAARLPAADAPGAPATVDRRLLFYVTPEPSMPRAAMRTMVDEVNQKSGAAGFRSSLFWLCWLDLYVVVEWSLAGSLGDVERSVLERLAAYLRSRRLESVSSIRPPEGGCLSWDYTTTEWQRVFAVGFRGGAVARHGWRRSKPMTAWQDLFSELRRLYGGASRLLIDAERLVDHQGWRISHAKKWQIGSEVQEKIEKPDLWAPHYVARFFDFEQQPAPVGPLLYIACVLSDGGRCDYSLPGGQPVVTAGVIRYRQAIGAYWGWKYWMAKSWFWTDKAGCPKTDWQTFESDGFSSFGIERVESIAVPLEQVTDRESLERLVIEPLLEKAGLRRGPQPDLDDAA